MLVFSINFYDSAFLYSVKHKTHYNTYDIMQLIRRGREKSKKTIKLKKDEERIKLFTAIGLL